MQRRLGVPPDRTEMGRAYRLIGREIVEGRQRGQRRAGPGVALIEQSSARLQAEVGRGFAPADLCYMRLFYATCARLLAKDIRHAARDESAPTMDAQPNPDALPDEAGRPNPDLSWAHYRLLTKVASPYARVSYEVDTARHGWSSRELERQLTTSLAGPEPRQGRSHGARHAGQEAQTPADAIKDPVVPEFLGLPESPRLVESALEAALLASLPAFLRELGTGFAFVAARLGSRSTATTSPSAWSSTTRSSRAMSCSTSRWAT